MWGRIRLSRDVSRERLRHPAAKFAFAVGSHAIIVVFYGLGLALWLRLGLGLGLGHVRVRASKFLGSG